MSSKVVVGLLGAAAVAPLANAFVSPPAGLEQLRGSSVATSAATTQQQPSATSAQSSLGLSAPAALAGLGAALLAGGRLARPRPGGAAAAPGVTAVRAFEGELGVQPPTGFWDPAGYCSDGDKLDFYRRRCVEVKHGRVAMIACIGYIVPEYFRWPGFCSPSAGIKFADIGTGLAALGKVPALGWFQWVFFCGQMELFAAYQDSDLPPGKLSTRFVIGGTSIKSDYLSGWTYGPFGVPNAEGIKDPEARKKKLNAEIANGRLAMFAIMGMFFQDGLTGSAWGDWALFVDSPLRAYENDTGVQAPIGFWDPLGLATGSSNFDYKRRKEVEIKHGRVSMFATIGYIVPEYTRLPGFLSPSYGIKYADVPNGLAALSKVPALGWCQFIAFIGFVELNVYNEQINGEPGNYGAGFLGIRSIGIMSPGFKDPETRKKKLNSEIANGRLAMMAIIGMFFQDGLTGSAWGDWALYTASPLRAFEGELGVQPPTGFWDPAGYCSDGDKLDFYRRRCVEIKHGRVAMIACIGYIVPEYFRWPGFCSPSAGIKFADIGTGLAALGKVPALGWFQWVFFCGQMELFAAFQDSDLAPGKLSTRFVIGGTSIKSDYLSGWTYGPFGVPNAEGIKDPEARKKKLNAEIANGRLAMFAIMGMFFQDGLTGSAWGDWALFVDSPLRAFEAELGVQAPAGFWDPLEFTSDGSKENYLRRRAVEIKHGRVSMYACMGYIVPEYTKFPGYLSPSLGIKFADVPNGLGAFSKVPFAGWAQIVLFCGLIENTGFFQGRQQIGIMKDATMTNGKGPGNYGLGWLGAFNKLTPVPALRTRKLQSEIANGRLAMFAIMGLLFQNGTFGTTGPEMWSVQFPEYANTVGDFIPKNLA